MQAIALAAEQLISERGVYDLSMELYHGQCCAGPSVSSSNIRDVIQRSPLHFNHRWSGNPKAEPRKVTEYMVKGQAAHHLLLGEAGFRDKFLIRPDELEDKPWHSNRTVCRQWLADAAKSGKTVLLPQWISDIRGMAEQLMRNPLVKVGGILNGEIEKSLIWQDEETGLWVKSRPDAIPSSSGDTVDIKVTSSSMNDDDLGRSIAVFGYHIQGAVIGLALRHVLEVEMESFSLVFIESEAPYSVRVKTISAPDIELGVRQVRAGLRQIRRCIDTKKWPGPGGEQTDAETIHLPPWAKTRMETDLSILEASMEMQQ